MTMVSRKALLVGMIGVLVAIALAGRLLVQNEGDPTIFASFGKESEITAYAEQLLGRTVVQRESVGHDGRFFFVLANDPWLTSPENSQLMDRPAYRAQRMFYPMIAGGGGLLGGEATTWGLIMINMVAMGVGTWGVATLASDMGGSPWWGLAFVLNVGLISEMNIDGAGVVAAAAAFWALVMIRRGKMPAGIALLVVSAMSREAMLIAAAGSAYWLWRRGTRKGAITSLAVPVASVAAWALFVRLRLSGVGSDPQVEEIGWPLVGLAKAFQGWLSDPIDLVAGIVILLLLVLFARRALNTNEVVGWAFLGFVPLALLFTQQVWLSYFDISRAVAPALTAFVLLVFVDDQANDRTRRVDTGALA